MSWRYAWCIAGATIPFSWKNCFQRRKVSMSEDQYLTLFMCLITTPHPPFLDIHHTTCELKWKILCVQLFDRKTSCWCFDWMLQSSSLLPWEWLEHLSWNVGKFFPIIKLYTENLLWTINLTLTTISTYTELAVCDNSQPSYTASWTLLSVYNA